MKRFLILLFVVIAFSCGIQKQLQKAYVGQPAAILEEKFGKAKTILDQGEEKIYVFERTEELESTEISQHKLTLDPMVTPRVKKTERFYFTVKEGIILKAKLEEEYER